MPGLLARSITFKSQDYQVSRISFNFNEPPGRRRESGTFGGNLIRDFAIQHVDRVHEPLIL